MTIRGVGPDEPITANARGYLSSQSPYRMDLMPGAAILHMAAIMGEGAKTHGEDNWRAGAATPSEADAKRRTYANVAAVVDASGNTPSTSALKANTPNTMEVRQLRHDAVDGRGARDSYAGSGDGRGKVNEHLNKMLVHAMAYLAGDRSDDHLGHLAWRAMAALEIELTGGVDEAPPGGAGP